MEWKYVFQLISIIGGSGAVIIAAVTFIGKGFVTFLFNRASDFNKNKLDQELEIHKHKLEILKLEHEYLFSELHKKRMEVVEELYARIADLHLGMIDLATGFISLNKDEGEKEKIKRIQLVIDTYDKFREYFNQKKIYFTSEQCKMIQDLLDDFHKKGMEITDVERQRSYGMIGEEMVDVFKKAIEAGKYIKTEIPKLLLSLQGEFKSVIGLKESK
jgi:hypothetical protein